MLVQPCPECTYCMLFYLGPSLSILAQQKYLYRRTWEYMQWLPKMPAHVWSLVALLRNILALLRLWHGCEAAPSSRPLRGNISTGPSCTHESREPTSSDGVATMARGGKSPPALGHKLGFAKTLGSGEIPSNPVSCALCSVGPSFPLSDPHLASICPIPVGLLASTPCDTDGPVVS
jgi:hypothetical protein